MSTALQPKRWQRADDPIFDTIRHHAWFNRLQKRKTAIPRMESCYSNWKDCHDPAQTQEEHCALWHVSPREFRDFCRFSKSKETGIYDHPSPVFQSVIDNAYTLYCDLSAAHPFQRYIDAVAPHYGLKGRPVWEEWETNWGFYPKQYKNKAEHQII